jgi:3D (Asp-Asp-Asp) domain-containing protein
MNHHPRRCALLLAAAATLLAACAATPVAPPDPPSATPTSASTPPPPATATSVVPQVTRQQVEVTFYAAADNDPPGSSDIAHPNTRHSVAGGSGTYQDPLTLATDPREIRPGALVYYPPLQKYFVMEDDCAPCIDEWTATRNAHVDLWMSASVNPAVQTCEAALTPDNHDTIEINPPPGLPIDPRPLYDSAGRCWPMT